MLIKVPNLKKKKKLRQKGISFSLDRERSPSNSHGVLYKPSRSRGHIFILS